MLDYSQVYGTMMCTKPKMHLFFHCTLMQKNLFDNLDPRSALIIGCVSGLLVLCTLGFIIMLSLLARGTLQFGSAGPSSNYAYKATADDVANAKALPPPPANIPKSDRPKVELFVMSYCPYGLQMEKGFLPVWQTLGKKADFDLKFVHYAMHGLKEVEENTRQHCIESEQPKVFQAYLSCFAAGGNSDGCLASAKVNTGKLKVCTDKTDKQFGVMAQYNDQSKWLSGQFPIFPIDQTASEGYGVQGSPTLVINGAIIDSSRSPEAIKQAVCASFNNPPAECGQTLSTVAFVPGFGTAADSSGSGGSATPGCGT